MSKYTTELRWICENATGMTTSSSNFDELVQKSIPKIFDFNFPVFDESYRNVLCTKIIKHYFTREIGFETVGLWKMKLNTKMNEIMPYYNQLYRSAQIDFNPMQDTDFQINHDGKSSGVKDSKDVAEGSSTLNKTDKTTWTEHEHGTGTNDGTSDTTTHSQYHDSLTDEETGHSKSDSEYEDKGTVTANGDKTTTTNNNTNGTNQTIATEESGEQSTKTGTDTLTKKGTRTNSGKDTTTDTGSRTNSGTDKQTLTLNTTDTTDDDSTNDVKGDATQGYEGTQKINRDDRHKFIDTPQGKIEDMLAGNYLTNASQDVANDSTTDSNLTKNDTHSFTTFTDDKTLKRTGTETTEKVNGLKYDDDFTKETTHGLKVTDDFTDTDTSSESFTDNAKRNKNEDKTFEEHLKGSETVTDVNSENTEGSGTKSTTGETDRTETKKGDGDKDGTEKVVSSGSTENNVDRDGEKTFTSTIDGSNNGTTTGNVTFNNTDEYIQNVVGKRGTASYSKLLMEYRETFINIDMDVIRALEPLFFGLW